MDQVLKVQVLQEVQHQMEQEVLALIDNMVAAVVAMLEADHGVKIPQQDLVIWEEMVEGVLRILIKHLRLLLVRHHLTWGVRIQRMLFILILEQLLER